MSQVGNNGALSETSRFVAILTAAGQKLEDLALNVTPEQMVNFVGMVVGAVVPGATLVGMSIATLTKLAAGVAANIPAAVEAYDEMKALSDAGTAPTPEQWAKWNAAADLAHAHVQEAADAVMNG